MQIEKALLAGIYAPLILAAITALVMYGGSVLLPAFRARELRVKEHGVVIGMALIFVAYSVENAYYWGGRIWPEHYDAISWVIPAVIATKALILVGIIFTIGGWMKTVYQMTCMPCLFCIAGGMWTISTAFFLLAWKI